MDQDSPAKPREQKVSSQRTRWKILLLILCLLHGSSMTPPHRQPHSGELQAGSPPSRTPLCTMEAHRASTPPCCWKNSLTGANALRGPRLVSGEPGGAVTIRCHYAPSSVNRHQRKYWCRLAPPLWTCYTIVSTNHYTHRDYRGRVALTDFPQSALFMVKLFRLSPNDTGLYCCGIGDRNDKLFFRMNLIVSPGLPNTTYAAAVPASGELITASSGIGSTAANRSTPGVTQSLEGQGSAWDRTAPTTRISKTTVPANGRSTLRIIARTTAPGKSTREEGYIKTTVPTPESPASKSRSMFSTTQGAWVLGAQNSVTSSASTSEGGRTGTVPEAEEPQWETEVSTSPGAPEKTTGTTQPSVLISEPVTWETLQEATDDSKQQLLYSSEEPSSDPGAWTLNATRMQVASGSIGRTLENTGGESSPPTPSQLSSWGPMWTPGKRSSMKSVFTEGESNTWILTPVSSVLALVLLAALVLLKRRPWRTSQKTERSPRITLSQMTHFLPDKLSDVGKSLQQGDPPSAQASLTVLKKDSGP
ncbi:high affinity immunoglobulin alpha and immunoglobulin mu Fc receptor [Microtus ochrogaster]|uniref:high affinity immunoglobulin alpha and immunoglobulin mu Fc receptor n=1 Tax=Microtus ochrogaster TaxID=79684 RepID=UPI00038C240C|nr:high affinity immunoglobulin alpha and immunoglobulin mu Fc receptor [Microtus ochrogaster]